MSSLISSAHNRRIFLKKASAWVGFDLNFSFHAMEGADVVYSGRSTDTFNIIALDPDFQGNIEALVEKARQEIFAPNNRFAVWSWRQGQLDTLSGASEPNLVMTCTVGERRLQGNLRQPLAISHAPISDAGHVLAALFEGSPEVDAIQSLYGLTDGIDASNFPLKCLAAYEDGRPIASGSYVLDESTAGIFDIAVLPTLRHKGIGTMMFEAVLDAASREGATSLTLQATAVGAGIYKRAGFQTAGTCWCLDFSPEGE